MKRGIMNLETTTVTRRTVLGGVIASALASMVPSKVFAEVVGSGADDDADGPKSNKANLYAFPGVQLETTVIAATWPVHLNRFDWSTQKESHVTIHAGARKWDVELPGGSVDTALLERHGCRVFAGSVATQPGADGVALKAVIIKMPKKMQVESGPMEIWAERVLHTGQRQRVGSPFIAALLAEDPGLAQSYHNLSPSDDRAMLMEDVVRVIAAKGRKSGMAGDPDTYARRVASRLLPDVLRYDPQWPSGFTFAAQNGRHPEEVSDLVVDTILSGSPALGSPKADVHLQEPFPFFSRRDSAA
ncbi:YdeI/OmpD-associated family protein [Tunturiibacter empetritectus]|uniref:Uncharacterized protein n=1 Tax=Tunturiibacter lichenicola TaxID=2051959 RepID=A0A852VIZ5_9BACT|nr:YdeI/OmpD-associated family protein [Edaphobacter lichenicola]NYF90145.1 hypothetical protein [Edaphobacter lichenicola]